MQSQKVLSEILTLKTQKFCVNLIMNTQKVSLKNQNNLESKHIGKSGILALNFN